MGMLIDSVKNKSYTDANNIVLLLIDSFMQSIFSFRLSLFINFTEHTLANRLSLYSNLVKLPMSFFRKSVGN
jgi:hypothetical protein